MGKLAELDRRINKYNSSPEEFETFTLEDDTVKCKVHFTIEEDVSPHDSLRQREELAEILRRNREDS